MNELGHITLNIKTIITKRNISSHELSKLSGLSSRSIYNLIDLNRDVKISTLVKIAKALNVSLTELISEGNEQLVNDNKEVIQVEENRLQEKITTLENQLRDKERIIELQEMLLKNK